MATKRRRVFLYCSILAVIFAAPVSSAYAQDAPAIMTQPLGEEAYQLLTWFYEYDRDIPLEARIVGKEDLPNCTREKIVFRVRDSWVIAYLGIPKSGSPPYPCVLGLHGLSSDKSEWWNGNMASALLNDGIAVFTPDAQYHGERSHSNGFESAGVMVLEKRWIARWRDMVVQTIVDSRRAMDYFETRPEIDAKRCGVIGFSMGGIETFALTALDSRVRVAVACCTPSSHHMAGVDRVIAPRNYARGLKDRPFLMLMGRNDPLCTAEQAQLLFDSIPGSRKEIIFYDSGHWLPPEYVPKATAWLQEGLKVKEGDKP